MPRDLIASSLSNVNDHALSTPNPADDRIIRSREVQQLTGLSRTTLWRPERAGKFPLRVALCPGSVGWRLSEVEEWIRCRK